MPVSTASKITALSDDLGSERRLAELLEVSPAQVTRWKRGGSIDDLSAEKVDLLEFVIGSLLRVYPLETVRQWLVGINPNLGDRRPIDLVSAGKTRELLDAISVESAGSFS